MKFENGDQESPHEEIGLRLSTRCIFLPLEWEHKRFRDENRQGSQDCNVQLPKPLEMPLFVLFQMGFLVAMKKACLH